MTELIKQQQIFCLREGDKFLHILQPMLVKNCSNGEKYQKGLWSLMNVEGSIRSSVPLVCLPLLTPVLEHLCQLKRTRAGQLKVIDLLFTSMFSAYSSILHHKCHEAWLYFMALESVSILGQ